MDFLELMKANTGSKKIREKDKILIVSLCLKENKDIFSHFGDYTILLACPEKDHVNMIGFKLLGVILRCKPKVVAVLTVDGSMHCVGLHYVVEELHKAFEGKFKREHFVYNEGKIIKVSERSVKISRYLHKVEKLSSTKFPGKIRGSN